MRAGLNRHRQAPSRGRRPPSRPRVTSPSVTRTADSSSSHQPASPSTPPESTTSRRTPTPISRRVSALTAKPSRASTPAPPHGPRRPSRNSDRGASTASERSATTAHSPPRCPTASNSAWRAVTTGLLLRSSPMPTKSRPPRSRLWPMTRISLAGTPTASSTGDRTEAISRRSSTTIWRSRPAHRAWPSPSST